MKLFDTHAHIYDHAFDDDREAMLHLAFENVDYIVCPSENCETGEKSLALTRKYSQVYAAVGIHPHYTREATETDWEQICAWIREKKVVAIGETGLDYFYMHSPKEVQQEWFIRQIKLGVESDLPIIIHDRKAHGDTLRILKEQYHPRMRGIMHCFSGSREFAKEVMKLGFYISFAGSVVFPNSKKLKTVAESVPLDRLLIETDSPYLTPPPHRGERNHPGNVYYVAEEIAKLRGIPIENIIEQTRKNALCIYNLEK